MRRKLRSALRALRQKRTRHQRLRRANPRERRTLHHGGVAGCSREIPAHEDGISIRRAERVIRSGSDWRCGILSTSTAISTSRGNAVRRRRVRSRAWRLQEVRRAGALRANVPALESSATATTCNTERTSGQCTDADRNEERTRTNNTRHLHERHCDD